MDHTSILMSVLLNLLQCLKTTYKKQHTMTTKISSIFDVGSTGLPVDMEMSLGEGTAKRLRAAFAKRLKRVQGRTSLELISGNMEKGNCVLWLKFDKADGDATKITYEFAVKKGTTFLNVMCNPTVLMAGDNTLPVVVEGRSPYETFQIMNRLPYSILEEVLEEEGFEWKGEDKQRLREGDLNFKQLQVAFYSGDLGEQRHEVMLYLRTIYCGSDAVMNRINNLAEGLNLDSEMYNDNQNLRISSRTGKNTTFSLVMYHKDRLSKDKVIAERVKNLIRYDCTFHFQFLYNNKINKISLLEEKYRELCGTTGSDKKFVIWLRNKILDRIKLKYIMSLDRAEFVKNLARAEEDYRNDTKSVIGRVFWCWRRDQNFKTQKQLAAAVKASTSAVSKACKYLEETYNFDMDISRSYMDAMFFNSALSMIQDDERSEINTLRENDNRAVPTFQELQLRAANRLGRVRDAIKDQGGLLNIRRMTPREVKSNRLYIHDCMGIESKHVWVVAA